MKKVGAVFARWWPFSILVVIVLLVFYKSTVFGKIPFPGDLLLSEYAPWRHSSYFGYVSGTIPSKAQYFDVVRELYPWKTLVIQQIRKFQFPLWNPYNFSGTPLLANYQSQVFYPLSVIYLFLPQKTAWTILIVLQPLLGSVFLYLFATEIGISTIGAMIAALLFNFSGFANVWMEFNTVWHTILWIPFLLYLFERTLRLNEFPLRFKILYIFGLFSSITGGHPQDFIDIFLFLSIFEAVRLVAFGGKSKMQKIHLATQYAGLTVISFLIASPQLAPTIELFRYSSRVVHDIGFVINTMLVQWWELVMIVIQDFFGNPATHSYYLPDSYVNKTLSIGVTGFILVLAFFFQKKHSWHGKFFLWTAGAIILLTVNTPITQLFYRYPIPILATGSPTRILVILALAMSVLAGIGYDYIKDQTIRIMSKPLTLTCTILAFLWGIILFHIPLGPVKIQSGISVRALLLASGIFISAAVILITGTKLKIIRFSIIVLVTAEILYSFVKFNPFVPPSFVFPPNDVLTYLTKHAGINRYWGYGTTRMESNLNLEYGLFSADGTDPLNLSWYNKFIQASANGKLANSFSRTTRSDVALTPGYGENDLPDNPFRLRMMDLLGIKYVLNRFDNPQNNNTFSSGRFKEVFSSEDGYTIFENLQAYPRVFLADSVKVYTDDSSFEKIFFDPSFDPRTTVLLPSGSPLPITEKTENKTASVYSYAPDKVSIQTNSDKPQILFLSDTYDPGWRAKIDGRTVPVYRADYAFRAVGIPEGPHIVVFTYQPGSFSLGLALSGMGMVVLLLFIVSDILAERRMTRS